LLTAVILSTLSPPPTMTSLKLGSLHHEKFEWEDEDPRPISTTETSFTIDTLDSAETLHDNDQQPPEPDLRNNNRMLIPQIAELPLTPQVSRVSRPPATRIATNASAWTTDPAFEVDWEDGDPDNPRNWPLWYKSIVLFAISYGTLIVYGEKLSSCSETDLTMRIGSYTPRPIRLALKPCRENFMSSQRPSPHSVSQPICLV